METHLRSQRPLGLTIGLFIAAALLTTLPRLLPAVELSRRYVLWIPVIHQITLALMLATIVWLLTGKRRSVAVYLALLIVVVWGPNIAGAVEYSLTGSNETVLEMSKRVGLTATLNTVYGFFYNALGYSLTIQRVG